MASRIVNFDPAIAAKKIIDISIEYPNDHRCCGNAGYLQLDEPRIPLFHRSGCTRCIASCVHANKEHGEKCIFVLTILHVPFIHLHALIFVHSKVYTYRNS